MSETVVRVDLRQATLSESARMREAADQLFLALDSPPPVRSLLRLIVDDEPRAFEVARVIEVIDDDQPARGCYGRYVDLERLDEQTKVGSEHLEPGISGSGVPSPVVIMNTNEMMLGEAGEESEESEESADSDESDGDDESEANSEADSEDGESDDAESESNGESESGDDKSGDAESESNGESESESGDDGESGDESEDNGNADSDDNKSA